MLPCAPRATADGCAHAVEGIWNTTDRKDDLRGFVEARGGLEPPNRGFAEAHWRNMSYSLLLTPCHF